MEDLSVEIEDIIAEENDVEYDSVHLLLAIFVPILCLLAKYVGVVSTKVSKLFYTQSEKEIALIKSAIELKKEMNAIPMVAEFAKYAKIQRRLNMVNLDIETTVGSRRTMQSNIRRVITIFLHVLTGLATAAIMYLYRSTPVFIIPENWFYPLSGLLSYPTEIPGAISVLTWMFLIRNVTSIVLQDILNSSNSNNSN